VFVLGMRSSLTVDICDNAVKIQIRNLLESFDLPTVGACLRTSSIDAFWTDVCSRILRFGNGLAAHPEVKSGKLDDQAFNY